MATLLPFRERERWSSPFPLERRVVPIPSTYPYERKDREGEVAILLPFRERERWSFPFPLERREVPIPDQRERWPSSSPFERGKGGHPTSL